MALKWYCDQCEKEVDLSERGWWELRGPDGVKVFDKEACLLGWLWDRVEDDEELPPKETRKDRLVALAETMIDAAHDFLDAECEGAIKRD